jgi:uncharacterized delta-60 repeat protein
MRWFMLSRQALRHIICTSATKRNRLIMAIGYLDNTFSGDGKLQENIVLEPTLNNRPWKNDNSLLVGLDIATGTVIQENAKNSADNGKIIVAGTVDQLPTNPLGATINGTAPDSSDYYLRRFYSNGKDDTTFNTNVISSTPSRGDRARNSSTILQRNGFLYVIGSIESVVGNTFDIFIAKYDSEGILKSAFGGGQGFALAGISSDKPIETQAVFQSDGKLVVAGSVNTLSSTGQDIFIARFNTNDTNSLIPADGTLDSGFGDVLSGSVRSGKTIVSVGDVDAATAVKIQPVKLSDGSTDERIVVTGFTESSSGSKDTILLRYSSVGSPDTAFNSKSRSNSIFSTGNDLGRDLLVLPGGKILVVGEIEENTPSSKFILARYNNDGLLDTTFDLDGVIDDSANNGTGKQILNGVEGGAVKVAQDAMGKIVIAGRAKNGDGDSDVAVVRLNPDGRLDAGFGTNGVLITPVGSSVGTGGSRIGNNDEVWGLTIDKRNDDIIVTGSTDISSALNNSDSFTVKYKGDPKKARLGADFSRDGKRDFIWRNQNSGVVLTWKLDGVEYKGFSLINKTILDLNLKIVSSGDFDRDGKDDILLRNISTGENVVWYMDGDQFITERNLAPLGGNDWQIKATADFNRDGNLDILWRRASTGDNVVWYLGGVDGITYQGATSLGPSFTGGWDIRAANDFNLDGRVDLVWRNQTSGDNFIWYLGGIDGTEFRSGQSISAVIDQNWNIVGSGDFNVDGEADLLWRNSASGQNVVWTLGGTSNKEFIETGFVGSDWKLQGNGDFDGDGSKDYIWRNQNSGAIVAWFLNQGSYRDATSFSDTYLDQNWQIVSAGDFNRDGKDDLFWRNISTGQNIVWRMDGVTKRSEQTLAPLGGNDWQIKATADFNRDGNLDILWRRASTGDNVVWYLGGVDGITYQGASSIGPSFTGGWDIRAANDFNLDGNVDIAWRNSISGDNFIWYLSGSDGTVFRDSQNIIPVGDQNWNIVGSNDFNNDGEADLVWRNSLSGQTQIWTLGGTNIKSSLGAGFVGTEWQLL